MLTDGRTDGRKIGRLYRTLLQAGAIKMVLTGISIHLKTGAYLIQVNSHYIFSFKGHEKRSCYAGNCLNEVAY